MNKNEQEIFEKYAKMNEALRIAKDALRNVALDIFVADYQTEYRLSVKQAKEALSQIDEVLNENK